MTTPAPMPDEGQHREHVENFKASVQNATPSETRAGNRWYAKAHRDAVHSGLEMMPGVKVEHPSGNGVLNSPAGMRARHEYRQANPGVDVVDRIRENRNSPATKRAAYEIAATSPASPSGMDWEKNAQGAWEAAHMHPREYEGAQRAIGANNQAQKARGALKKAQNRGQPVTQLQQTYDAALQHSQDTSAEVRTPFKGKSLAFVGNENMSKAYEIHHGMTEPEAALGAMKTQHFARAVAGDMSKSGTTVDEHMANILGGRTKWNVKKKGVTQQDNSSERSIPSVVKPAGYEYAKSVIEQGAQEMGRDPVKSQAIGWLHEKNVKNAVENDGQRSRQDRARATINRNTSNRLLENM